MVYTSSSSSSSSGASDSEVSDVDASDEPVVGSIPEDIVIICRIKNVLKITKKTYHSRVSRFDLVRKSLSIARVGTFPSYKLLYAHHSLIHDHLPLMGMAKSSSLAIST